MQTGKFKAKFLSKSIVSFLAFLICFSLTAITANAAQPTKQGISINPAIIKTNLRAGEKVSQQFTLNYIGFEKANLTFLYKEFDKEYNKSSDSTLLKSILELSSKEETGKSVIETNIDTKSLIDKTYFFGLTIIVNIQSSNKSINTQIAANIPIILTVNTSDTSQSPKPFIKLDLNGPVVFNENNLKVGFQIENQSDKLIDLGGQLIILNEKNEEIYSEKVSIPDDRLLPKTFYQTENKGFNLSQNNLLPFFGKVKIIYKGTLDNRRHITSQEKEVYLIPYQYIVLIILLVLFAGFVPFILITRKKKKINKQGITSLS